MGTGHHSYGRWQFPEEPIPSMATVRNCATGCTWKTRESQCVLRGLAFIITPTAAVCLLQIALLWSHESNAGMISPHSRLICSRWINLSPGLFSMSLRSHQQGHHFHGAKQAGSPCRTGVGGEQGGAQLFG